MVLSCHGLVDMWVLFPGISPVAVSMSGDGVTRNVDSRVSQASRRKSSVSRWQEQAIFNPQNPSNGAKKDQMRDEVQNHSLPRPNPDLPPASAPDSRTITASSLSYHRIPAVPREWCMQGHNKATRCGGVCKRLPLLLAVLWILIGAHALREELGG